MCAVGHSQKGESTFFNTRTLEKIYSNWFFSNLSTRQSALHPEQITDETNSSTDIMITLRFII